MKGVFVHDSAVIDNGASIGPGTKIWHFSHIMSTAIIGKDCSIGQNVFIADEVRIGNNVKIQNNVSIYRGVICEDDIFIGPSVVFTNVKNPRSFINRKNEILPTLVRKGATIGANATIVCGTEIGAYSFIGAGTVITHQVPEYALVVGNPGKIVGWMSKSGYRLEFKNTMEATCPHTNEKYRMTNLSKVIKV